MSEHYFSNAEVATAEELTDVSFSVRGIDLQMVAAKQVFSAGRLDLGTKMLLTCAPKPPTQGTFLDLGCGWGPIACTLAALSPQSEVWAVDVNQRALALTEENAHVNHLLNIRTLNAETAQHQAEQEDIRFDLIWSNPPVRVGKTELHEVSKTWLNRLSQQGQAWLVMARNLGADSYIAWLNGQGFNAEKTHSKKGYRIIRVTRS